MDNELLAMKDAQAAPAGPLLGGGTMAAESVPAPFAPNEYSLPEAWEGVLWTPEGPSEVKASAEVAAMVNKYLAEASERAQFADIARRCDLTQKQAETLFGLYGGLLARHSERELARQAEYTEEKATAALWPRDTTAHIDTANRGAAALGFGEELREAGLLAHPLVLRMLHSVGQMLGDDTVSGLSAGGTAGLPRGEAAREELFKVVGSDAYRSNDPAAVRRAEALAARV